MLRFSDVVEFIPYRMGDVGRRPETAFVSVAEISEKDVSEVQFGSAFGVFHHSYFAMSKCFSYIVVGTLIGQVAVFG